MHLLPHEIDKLLLYQTGSLAQRRLARGLQLNHSEAAALIGFQVKLSKNRNFSLFQILEFIRDGKYSVSQLMDMGSQMLGQRHVLPGVETTLDQVQIEGTFYGTNFRFIIQMGRSWLQFITQSLRKMGIWSLPCTDLFYRYQTCLYFRLFLQLKNTLLAVTL